MDLAETRAAANAYLVALNSALYDAPAHLRVSEVRSLREELSWLDARATTVRLIELGEPDAAAMAIITEHGAMTLRRLRTSMRRVATTTVVLAVIGVAVLVVLRRDLGGSTDSGATSAP